jgi:hypothetical protein
MQETPKTPIPEKQAQPGKPQYEVVTFSEEQLYKIKKKSYVRKALRYFQEHQGAVLYILFMLIFLAMLAILIHEINPGQPKKTRQPSMLYSVPPLCLKGESFDCIKPPIVDNFGSDDSIFDKA